MIREVEQDAEGLLRIPPEMDVPISNRVRRLIDTPAMKHLGQISQLGLVHLVYPGARHSRLEHSLGVYRNSIGVLRTLQNNAVFRNIVSQRGAEAFVLAALLHDAGHWPFCHAIEDMRLAKMPRHESRVEAIIRGGEIAALLNRDWLATSDDLMSILLKKHVGDTGLSDAEIELVASCVSGPVDIDKLDYLVRDSVHVGVPYGRNFDVSRLMSSLTVHPRKPRLAFTDKGRTAAEMMVFARYVMFSEVYWHHAVRSATAMLQRLVFELQTKIDLQATFDLDDAQWISTVREAAAKSEVASLAEGLFGSTRSLYKRAVEFNILDRPELHRALAHRPYWWQVACGDELVRQLSRQSGQTIRGWELLIDAPPVKLEVDINMDVVSKNGDVRKLGDVSPVAHALAHQQFDGHVKRVRIFVSHHLRETVATWLQDDQWIFEAIASINREVV